MRDCEVCSQRLTAGEIWSNLRGRLPRSYPFRLENGSRKEMPVGWICTACVRRAGRRRKTMDEAAVRPPDSPETER